MSSSYPWLFLSELLVIGGVWLLIVELSSQFNSKEYFEEVLRAKILNEDYLSQKIDPWSPPPKILRNPGSEKK
ncbi:MAG: hypothetical protein WC732_04550 [Candidatus Omnitrophota bacterium]